MMKLVRPSVCGVFVLGVLVAWAQDKDPVKPTWTLKAGDRLSFKFKGRIEVNADRQSSTSIRYSGTADLQVDRAEGDITGQLILTTLKFNGNFKGMAANFDYRRPASGKVEEDHSGSPHGHGPAPAPGGGPGAQKIEDEEKPAGGDGGKGPAAPTFKPVGGSAQLDFDSIPFVISSTGEASFDTRKMKMGGTHLVVLALLTDLWSGLPRNKTGPGGTWPAPVRLPIPKADGMISWESANTTAQAGEKLQTVSGEPCFIFTQNVAADSKAKNKLESARKTSFGVKAGFCVEFTENATSKIDAPVGESVKGRVELEREVTLSR